MRKPIPPSLPQSEAPAALLGLARRLRTDPPAAEDLCRAEVSRIMLSDSLGGEL